MVAGQLVSSLARPGGNVTGNQPNLAGAPTRCAERPAFPAPSVIGGTRFLHNPGASRRENADTCLSPMLAIELDDAQAGISLELNRQAQPCKVATILVKARHP